MVIASKAASIGVIIISLAIGLITFYIYSSFSKEKKKKYTEELGSQLINFIIFIWISKILLNLSLFIEDPLAVLAYPGDSGAFNLAVLFTAMLIVYKFIRNQIDLLTFADGFTHVFLIALFFYEFFQIILGDGVYSLGYLILLSILLFVFVLGRGQVKTFILLITVLIGWTIGMFILSFMYPFVTVFGYLIEPWFIILFFIGCLPIIILSERKRKS